MVIPTQGANLTADCCPKYHLELAAALITVPHKGSPFRVDYSFRLFGLITAAAMISAWLRMHGLEWAVHSVVIARSNHKICVVGLFKVIKAAVLITRLM